MNWYDKIKTAEVFPGPDDSGKEKKPKKVVDEKSKTAGGLPSVLKKNR